MVTVSPERRWRLLLRAYPRAYRTERGQEMLDVLLATEDRRGRSSGVSESVSLVGHGLSQRLRRVLPNPTDSPSLGLAGVSLVALLGLLGVQQLAANGFRGLGLDGYPEEWGLGILWVDPRWPVHVLWVATGLALLLGRHRLLVTSAWAAAALHAWLLVVTTVTTVDLPWPGDLGPHWVAPGGAAEASWALLSVFAAVLVGGPASAARARAALPVRRWRTVATVGLVVAALARLAVLTSLMVAGSSNLHLVEAVRGPMPPLVLAAAVLATGLVPTRQGRQALLIVAMLAAAPLAARWSGSMTWFAAATALFIAGYAARSWSRTPSPSTPSRA